MLCRNTILIPFLEGEDESFYEWPEEFKSDWLNEFTIATGRQDYRFVYIGPKDSHTGFHQDVLKSHSWSSNVCGKKLWHFWAPGTHPKEREGTGYITDTDVLSTATFIIEQNTGISSLLACQTECNNKSLLNFQRTNAFCTVRMVSSSEESRRDCFDKSQLD